MALLEEIRHLNDEAMFAIKREMNIIESYHP